MTITDAFDALAVDYDATFTDTLLGRRYRDAVWRRFGACFPAGSRVLEIGCGTGVDASELQRRGCSVLATDASAAMVGVTRARGVEARMLAAEELGALRVEGATFDGVLSNFGALNCVASLPAVAQDLAGLVRPGGAALLCFMGPFVPWELAWFGVRGQWRSATRRWRGPEEWRGMTVRYPSVRVASRAFAPAFALRRSTGVGVFLPPPYAESLAARHPGAVAMLDRVERRVDAWPGVAWLADHYVVELVRR